jgi:hypothetical protein
MWFWIALMAFFLIVFLASQAIVRSQGGPATWAFSRVAT